MKRRLLLLFTSLMIVSCGNNNQSPIDPGTHVDVEKVYAYNIPYIINYPGIVQGVVDYPVVPRVSGAIDKQYYKEGTYVKKGAPLYEIDPRPFALDLKNFQGQLIKDTAAKQNLKLIYDRYAALYKLNAVAEQDVENARINYQAAVGNVQSDQANVDQAKLNLLYCLVTSPADGYIAERQVTVGDMVSAFTTVLNHINSANNMYIVFSMPEEQRIAIENGVLDQTISVPKNYTFRVDLKLADGKVIPNAGYVEFTDTRISLMNGSWNMRAYVDNDFIKNKLLSGQFINVYIHGMSYENTFAIPQSAVYQDNQGPFVYLLKNGKAFRQQITTGKMIDDLWLIPSGLKNGDRVVIHGGIQLYPDAKVIVDNTTDSRSSDVTDNSLTYNSAVINKEQQEVKKLSNSNPITAKHIQHLNNASSINLRSY